MPKSLLLLFVLLLSPAVHATDGLIVVPSAHGVSESLDRAEAIFKKKGITVMARVLHDQGAAGVGLELAPLELLIFGNPKLGTPLMQSNPTVGIDLPMKLLAWQDADGKVWLAYNDPAWFAARHGITDRDAVVTKLRNALKGISAKVAAP